MRKEETFETLVTSVNKKGGEPLMFTRSARLITATALALALAACDDDDDGPSGPGEARDLALSLSGLEPLANGFHYEGWVILNGAPVSTGKFNVNSSGAVTALDGTPITGGVFNTSVDLTDATAAVITIEPDGDTDAVPANTKILAGPVSGGTASLTVSASQALGEDFSTASGVFILATPTDSDPNDEDAGIWFLDNSGASPAAGLDLPTLPAGWEYEGWAVVGGTPLSTGRFTLPSGADESSAFSGPLQGPPFPGEDFLQNAPAGLTFPLSLLGAMAVITIEPEPDDDPAPFFLKPLDASIASDAPTGTVIDLVNSAGSFPSGTASIQ